MPRRGISGASCSILPAFSSSVSRETRSSTRASIDRSGSQNGMSGRSGVTAMGSGGLPAVDSSVELAARRQVRGVVGVLFGQRLVYVDPEPGHVSRVQGAVREPIARRKDAVGLVG